VVIGILPYMADQSLVQRRASMARINWKYVILGGIVAASVWGLLYAPVHPLVEVHDSFGRPVLPITPFRGATRFMQVFVVLTGLVQGIATLWLYAAIGPRYGPGPKTALIAGFGVWFLTSWIHVLWAVFTTVHLTSVIAPVAANLPIAMLAAMAGAWLYKE
jgi:hypothetical protein